MRHHRWFKILALLLPLLLLAAACGDDDDDDEAVSGSDSTEDTAASDGEDGGGDAPTVGLVYDLGGRGDKSFNDAAAAGLDRAVEELGVEDPKELEPDEGGENREELMRLLAEDGTEVIFGIGFLFEDSIGAAAPDFPDSTFAIVDSVVEADNVASLVFAEEQGSFLVGAAAALKSESGHIGFVGGVETDLIKKFEAGYVAGAKHVKPEITVDVSYISQPPDFSGFNDPARGKEIAAGMYGAGADVVYGAAGGSGGGIFDAAVEAKAGGANAWAIGVDSDQYELVDAEAQGVILTSMLKKVEVAVFDTIERLANGEAVGGSLTTYDLEAGGIDYSTSGGYIDDITDQLEELKAQIISGDIEVPVTP